METNDLVGKIATCQKKFIGLIEKVKLNPHNGKTVAHGKMITHMSGEITVTKKLWQSSKPIVLANSLEEYKNIPTNADLVTNS